MEQGYTGGTPLKPNNTYVDQHVVGMLASRTGIDPDMPVGNEEVDPMGGWNHVEEWRGDAQYPASHPPKNQNQNQNLQLNWRPSMGNCQS